MHAYDDLDKPGSLIDQVYIGTPSVRIFHAQTTEQNSGERRVRGRDTANLGVNHRTALITCPVGQHWYIGT